MGLNHSKVLVITLNFKKECADVKSIFYLMGKAVAYLFSFV